jgi:hypothetical protein
MARKCKMLRVIITPSEVDAVGEFVEFTVLETG